MHRPAPRGALLKLFTLCAALGFVGLLHQATAQILVGPCTAPSEGGLVCADCILTNDTYQCFPNMPPGYGFGTCANTKDACTQSTTTCGNIVYDCDDPPHPLSPQPPQSQNPCIQAGTLAICINN